MNGVRVRAHSENEYFEFGVCNGASSVHATGLPASHVFQKHGSAKGASPPMARTLRFFPRQALMGDAGAAVVYYSEIFDATQCAEIEWEFRLYGATLATVNKTAQLETTVDPTLDQWTLIGAAIDHLVPGVTQANEADLLRFVRCKLTIPEDQVAVIEVQGIARTSS